MMALFMLLLPTEKGFAFFFYHSHFLLRERERALGGFSLIFESGVPLLCCNVCHGGVSDLQAQILALVVYGLREMVRCSREMWQGVQR
ncbi:hypothetical protein CEXT_214521 [Caerostris extrusa]|uniref:Secreted protein n=1 Tax=Caerostris extrusa TaxID=172846 RepID=A0AAV4S3W8_CAEEX|nr:hypothetical protein CEXT_214521 [Caerostris extrusa]